MGRSEVAIETSVSGIDIRARAPVLSLNTMVPGLSKPQMIEGLTVKDSSGPVPMNREIRTVVYSGLRFAP